LAAGLENAEVLGPTMLLAVHVWLVVDLIAELARQLEEKRSRYVADYEMGARS